MQGLIAAGAEYSSTARMLLILFTALVSAAVAILMGFFFMKRQSVRTSSADARSNANTRSAPGAPLNAAAAPAHVMPAPNRSWSLDRDCVRRAALLSRIVYFDAPRAKEELRRYHKKLGFKVVWQQGQLSENVQPMVVAKDHNNTLYVCFRGTAGISDLITDGLIRQVQFCSTDLGALDKAITGSFHQGFLSCLHQKVLSMRLLGDLVRSRTAYNARHVVFCGHSLGGALAHLALIKYMLANASSTVYGAEVIAIAFGAPHVCDKVARSYLRQHELNIEKKLYNFVAPTDPVPFLLNHLPFSAEILGRAASEAAPSWIADTLIFKLCDGLDPQFQQCLQWLATNVISVACETFTSKEVITNFAKLIGVVLDNRVRSKVKESQHCKWYVPVGNWFTHNRPMGTDEAGDMAEELRNADLDRHSMAKYFEDTVGRWQFSDAIPEVLSGQAWGQEDDVDFLEEVTRTAAPKIFSAVWYVEQKKITVVGDDLELIVQAQVDGVVWEPKLLPDRPGEVRLTPPSVASCGNENGLCPQEVWLVTCFGEATHRVHTQYAPVSVIWPNSCVAEAYQRCSLKLCLMVKLLPEKETRKYDEEIQLLRLSRETFLQNTRDHQLGWLISQVWPPVIDSVLRRHMSGSIVIDIPTTIGITDDMDFGCVAGGVGFVLTGVMMGELGVTSVPLLALVGVGAGVLPVAAIGALGGAGFCLARNLVYRYVARPSPVLQADGRCADERAINNYMDVLHLTSLVLGLGIPKPAINNESQLIPMLERKIQEEFKSGQRSRTDLRDAIRRDPTKVSDRRAHVSASAYAGPGAMIARRSVADCIDRAKFIHDVLHADDLLAKKVKVVLVVGPQNAGKSSLINCILGNESAPTGYYKVHTRNLECYHGVVRGQGKVVLVDSPGLDSDNRLADVKGAWQNMEGVPDLVIMVVLFQGDTNEMVQQLPEAVAKRTKCRKQMLVLNKCDQILSDASCLTELSAHAMEQIRRDFAGRAKLDVQDVIMTVLQKSVSQTTAGHLRERGVQLREEATRTFRNRIEHIS